MINKLKMIKWFHLQFQRVNFCNRKIKVILKGDMMEYKDNKICIFSTDNFKLANKNSLEVPSISQKNST